MLSKKRVFNIIGFAFVIILFFGLKENKSNFSYSSNNKPTSYITKKNARIAQNKLRYSKSNSILSVKKTLEEELLADSVLSIIRNYYVDEKRVTNEYLYKTILRSLSWIPKLNQTENLNSITLYYHTNKLIINKLASPTFRDVTKFFFKISQFVSNLDISESNSIVTKNDIGKHNLLLNLLLRTLDAHSSLLSKNEYNELKEGTEGIFGGLGIIVSIRDNVLSVIKPMKNSPAEKIGIIKNDKIISIDGYSTYGKTLDDLVVYMRGPPGSIVSLVVLRNGAYVPIKYNVKRKIITVDSVTSIIHKKNNIEYLHLKIDSFASRTSQDVLKHLNNFKKTHKNKINGLILDLSSNPGGLLDQAVQLSDIFLEKGVIVSIKGRSAETELANNGVDELDFPIVVLVNDESASASEIVAGALRDQQRALIVGMPTFGKGSVQTIFELPGNQALKLTVARYYTPSGHSIQNIGITPDIWLQPIYKHLENKNLLGEYRYKNEGSLKYSLSRNEVFSVKGSKWNTVSLKSFCLINDDESETEIEDKKVEVALKIFDSIYKTYGGSIPKSANRASHWLAIAGPSLNKLLDKYNNNNKIWLKKHLNISWNKIKRQSSAKISFNAKIKKVYKNKVQIQYSITNSNNYAAEQYSLFVSSPDIYFPTTEVFIGNLKANSTTKNLIEIKTPKANYIKKIPLTVGLAQGGIVNHKKIIKLNVNIKPAKVANIKIKTKILDNSGTEALFIKNNETFTLSIDLFNTSNIVANDLILDLYNLSGKQFRLKHNSLKLSSLNANKHHNFKIKLRSSEKLFTDNLNIGLSVSSNDFDQPVHSLITTQIKPSLITKRFLQSH